MYACFSLAMRSVSPMPWPVERYQSPSGVTPAASQSFSSFLLVPDSSPRETNTPCDSATAANASEAVSAPAMPAGSSRGPATTK